MTLPPSRHRSQADRRYFIGGSDARIILGTDETALLRLWREKRVRRSRPTTQRTCSSSSAWPQSP
jgi:predicted phage-related endonuclease